MPEIRFETKKDLSIITGDYVDTDEPRNITLEDCLIAMDNSGHNTQYNGIRNDGHFLIDFGDKTAWTDDDKPIKWIMNKPIQDQSEETKDLLFDLIVKK